MIAGQTETAGDVSVRPANQHRRPPVQWRHVRSVSTGETGPTMFSRRSGLLVSAVQTSGNWPADTVGRFTR